MKLKIGTIAVAVVVAMFASGVCFAAGDLIVNGNLGVGTPNPAAKAEINGDMMVSGQISVGSTGIKFSDNSVQSSAAGPTTQRDVKTSRALGTVYRNTTGKVMFVNATAYMAVQTALNAYTDSNPQPQTLVYLHTATGAGAGHYVTASFYVLPGNYYQVIPNSGSGTLVMWVEWY